MSKAVVLDVCCGSRMFWFDKADCRALFVDNRTIDVETVGGRRVRIAPDVVADFTSLPFAGGSFAHVVFDPPHFRPSKGTSGNMATQYGIMPDDWRTQFRLAFAECFRVLAANGTLIFKWCESDVPLRDLLSLTDEKPLYGHRSGKQAQTHWIAFVKAPDQPGQSGADTV